MFSLTAKIELLNSLGAAVPPRPDACAETAHPMAAIDHGRLLRQPMAQWEAHIDHLLAQLALKLSGPEQLGDGCVGFGMQLREGE